MAKKAVKPKLPQNKELVRPEYIKLVKEMMTDYAELLTRLGAVDEGSLQAYPEHVYLNEVDDKKIEVNVKKQLKKQYGNFIAPKKLQVGVALHKLNLGPNLKLKNKVKRGWAIVDRGAIAKKLK